MKKTIIVSIISGVVLLLYIIGINFVAVVLANDFSSNTIFDNTSESEGFGQVQLGVSDKVDVTVTRHRFYGKVVENYYASGSIGYLYIFNWIKMPMIINGTDMIYIHLSFLALLFVVWAIIVFLDVTGDKKTNSNTVPLERGLSTNEQHNISSS